MGMFDSIYDAGGHEWQTKAFACVLDRRKIGDELPEPYRGSFQVEVCGGVDDFEDSLATVRDGVIQAVPAERDKSLPLIGYHGEPLEQEV